MPRKKFGDRLSIKRQAAAVQNGAQVGEDLRRGWFIRVS